MSIELEKLTKAEKIDKYLVGKTIESVDAKVSKEKVVSISLSFVGTESILTIDVEYSDLRLYKNCSTKVHNVKGTIAGVVFEQEFLERNEADEFIKKTELELANQGLNTSQINSLLNLEVEEKLYD